jgi:hypothetical protein
VRLAVLCSTHVGRRAVPRSGTFEEIAMRLDRMEIATEPRRLAGRTEPRGTKTGFPLWGAFAFGGIFVVAGSLIVLVGTRVIPVDPRGVHAPWWVLTVMGVVFALCGLGVWGMGLRQYRAERHRAEARRRHPGRPELADHPWDPAGFAPPRWARAAKAVAGAVLMSLFISIFNWWAFFTDAPWMVRAVTILFDLILVLVLWETGVRIGRAIRFGGSRVEYGQFPFRPGQTVRLRWWPAPGIGEVRKGRFTLRCVKEWYEHRGHGKNRSAHLVQQEQWAMHRFLDHAGTLRHERRQELEFELPPHVPSTELSADQPVFWELEIELDLPGLDFEEIYLVPVYAEGGGSSP